MGILGQAECSQLLLKPELFRCVFALGAEKFKVNGAAHAQGYVVAGSSELFNRCDGEDAGVDRGIERLIDCFHNGCIVYIVCSNSMITQFTHFLFL